MATPDRACPDYPNECVHPWAHARTYAEVKASQQPADHPHTDPGDGRQECDRCGKWVFPAIHSCKGVPVTAAARARWEAGHQPFPDGKASELVSVAEQFTPADVELIAKVFITEARKNPVTPSPYSWGVTSRLLLGPNEHDIARAVLTALAAAGRLVPPDADTRVDCEINWTDVRSSRPGADVIGKSYDWPADQFDWWLAREIDAEAHRHRVLVDGRKRTLRKLADGSTLVGPWLPVPTTGDTP